MLYTIVDTELLCSQLLQTKPDAQEWVDLPHGKLMLNSGKISAVCSTDLKDYLNQDFYPGKRYRK